MPDSYTGNIFFVGMPGCGKSTLGKRISKTIKWPFIDLDVYIEEKYNRQIQLIFEEKGEKYFREIESQALVNVTNQFKNTVIALGGGSICSENNYKLVQKNGICVYLKMSPEALHSRLIQKPNKRPMFKGLDENQKLEKLKTLLAQREIFYSKANLIVDAMNIDTESLATKIKTLINIH
ncbi:MAG: shikimate kinase [Bacteroidota bacterium]|jgi:shikimate kinase